MKEFSIRLKEERKNNKFTQKQMAELLQIPLNTYIGYESLYGSHRELDQELLIKISDILEVSTDYLLGKEN